jgi:hypothetical protein
MQCCLSSSKISISFSESEAGVRLTKDTPVRRVWAICQIIIADTKGPACQRAAGHGLSLAPVESDSSKTAAIVAEL